MSVIIVFRHDLAEAISASVVVKNLRVVHACCQLFACLTLVGISTLHVVSFRDVSPPINSRNSGHHDHWRNTLICFRDKHSKSHQLPLFWHQWPWTSDKCCAEHAIPSLIDLHSRDSRSSLHSIWREVVCGARPFVMAHADTTQHPRVSASHCIVLANWCENCTDSPNSTTGRFQVLPHRRWSEACDRRPSVCTWKNNSLHVVESTM